MTTSTIYDSHSWIGFAEARRILGVGRKAIERLIDDRRVSVRAVPNAPRRLYRPEIEQVASTSVKPAEAV